MKHSSRRKQTALIFILAPLLFLFFLLSSSESFGQGWYNPSWSYRKTITIDRTKVPSTQTNFPVLFNLTDANLITHALSSGNDILFTSSDGITKIPYQRETYTSGTGALLAWVNVPSVSSAVNTVIYLYYGNSSSADQQQATSTWDANYKLVYHLGDASSPADDATSNNNNGVASAGVTFGATGQVGKATSYGAASRNISAGASLGIGATSNFTYEVWINVSSFTNNTNMTSANGSYWIDRTVGTNNLVSLIPAGNKYGWQIRDDNGNNLGGPNTGAITTGTWQHVALVRDVANNVFRQYLNGVQQTTVAFSGALPLTPPTPRLGSHVSFTSPAFLNGSLDEFRVSNVARSADWLATGYNNQSSPSTFYSVGTETFAPPFISGFTPGSGCANTTSVVITGTNFTGATAVKFGGTDAFSFIVNSPTQISAVPANGATGTISVVGPTGTGISSSTFTVNATPVASVTAYSDISCFNGNDGSITITATPNVPYFYSVNNGTNWTASASNPPFVFGGLSVANSPFRIKVKDNNGCISK